MPCSLPTSISTPDRSPRWHDRRHVFMIIPWQEAAAASACLHSGKHLEARCMHGEGPSRPHLEHGDRVCVRAQAKGVHHAVEAALWEGVRPRRKHCGHRRRRLPCLIRVCVPCCLPPWSCPGLRAARAAAGQLLRICQEEAHGQSAGFGGLLVPVLLSRVPQHVLAGVCQRQAAQLLPGVVWQVPACPC